VVEINGAAVDAVKQVLARLNAHGLHFAFLDPFDLAALNFDIVVALSSLTRIDMLVHISQMDLQRNVVTYATTENSPFDTFAPGWREKVSIVQGQQELRQQIFQFWRDKVAGLGVWPSTDMRLLTGSNNQPLYWLLLAAKHELAHKFCGPRPPTSKVKARSISRVARRLPGSRPMCAHGRCDRSPSCGA
jgi:three-Cys-motif partner protein